MFSSKVDTGCSFDRVQITVHRTISVIQLIVWNDNAFHNFDDAIITRLLAFLR